jgi:hypothetical protein
LRHHSGGHNVPLEDVGIAGKRFNTLLKSIILNLFVFVTDTGT